MTLDFTWALAGLLLVPLLILLERWRRRPRDVVWPSLLLWRAAASAAAPARRRVDPLLVCECAAVTLLSLAAAGPAVVAGKEARTAYVVKDVGPHMDARRADGRTAAEATEAELARILDAAGEARVQPARRGLVEEAASMPPADLRVLATNREGVEGEGYVVVGRAADGFNLAIDAVEVRGERLWFAVATDGTPREVRVRAGDAVLTVRAGEGVETAFAPSLEVLDEDNYDGDDRFALRRIALGARDETGSKLVRAALFGAGVPAREATAPDLVVTTAGGVAAGEPVRGAECIPSGIFEGLFLDGIVWTDARTREGEGILTWRGRALAAWLDERTLWLGLPVDREWDDEATLALLVEAAKRQRVAATLAPGEVVAGDAAISPAPGLVWTKGVDRPWDGRVPPARGRVAGRTALRSVLALLAAGILLLYLRAMLRRS